MMSSICPGEVDPLESLEGAFQGPPKFEKNAIFAHFDKCFKNYPATFLLIEYTASIICQLVTHGDLDPIGFLEGAPGAP